MCRSRLGAIPPSLGIIRLGTAGSKNDPASNRTSAGPPIVRSSRVASAIRSSLGTIFLGIATPHDGVASNGMSPGHSVVEPARVLFPGATNAKGHPREGAAGMCRSRLGTAGSKNDPASNRTFTGCPIVEPAGRFARHAPPIKKGTLAVPFLIGGGGGNRTRVRKPSTVRTTCLAWSFGSRLAPAGRQAGAQPVASTDPHGQATRPCREADVNDAAPVSRPSPSAS